MADSTSSVAEKRIGRCRPFSNSVSWRLPNCRASPSLRRPDPRPLGPPGKEENRIARQSLTRQHLRHLAVGVVGRQPRREPRVKQERENRGAEDRRQLERPPPPLKTSQGGSSARSCRGRTCRTPARHSRTTAST